MNRPCAELKYLAPKLSSPDSASRSLEEQQGLVPESYTQTGITVVVLEIASTAPGRKVELGVRCPRRGFSANGGKAAKGKTGVVSLAASITAAIVACWGERSRTALDAGESQGMPSPASACVDAAGRGGRGAMASSPRSGRRAGSRRSSGGSGSRRSRLHPLQPIGTQTRTVSPASLHRREIVATSPRVLFAADLRPTKSKRRTLRFEVPSTSVPVRRAQESCLCT